MITARLLKLDPPMPHFVDSHCHLQHEAFNPDRQEVLARALDRLAWLVVVGDDAGSSLSAAAMAAEPSTAGRVVAIAGVHPHNASKSNTDELQTLRRLLREPGVVGLGEIGLDYHYEYSPRTVQRDVLRSQLDMALELRVPVVFHCREAEEDFIELVEPVSRELTAGIMHCFGGDAPFARRCLEWGFYVSFAGNVTFPKAKALQEAAAIVPLDRLLIETDSPYLAPQPVRGRRCEPAYVLHTAQFLADLRGGGVEGLGAATAANAARAFSIPDFPHVPA